MIAVAVRLCQSASWSQLVAWCLLASLAAPFAVYVVRGSREDIRRGAILGLTMIILLVALVATANAVPILDPCWRCARGLDPQWVCWLYLCW